MCILFVTVYYYYYCSIDALIHWYLLTYSLGIDLHWFYMVLPPCRLKTSENIHPLHQSNPAVLDLLLDVLDGLKQHRYTNRRDDEGLNKELLCFEWSPPWHSIHPIWQSICHIFWHSIWHIFWHSIWHSIWRIFWHSIWHIFWHSIWHIFWHSIWHSFWYSIWHSFWHRSWGPAATLGVDGRGWGPAANTGALMVVVEVRQRTLGVAGRGWGPAANTGRGWSWLRSGSEHWAWLVVVEVRQRTLGVAGRGWGPAANTGRGWSWLRSGRRQGGEGGEEEERQLT